MQRRVRQKPSAKQDVVEFMTVVSKDELLLLPRRRLIIENSSNQMNHLGPMVTQDPTDTATEWHLTVQEKRQLLGDSRKDGGGPAPKGTDPKDRKRLTDTEPVALHGNSVDFFRELLHSFWAASATDYTPLNENFALAAVRANVPYVAVCNNDYHALMLKQRLEDRVYAAFLDQSCPELYEPMAVADLLATPTDTSKTLTKKTDTSKRPAPDTVDGKDPKKPKDGSNMDTEPKDTTPGASKAKPKATPKASGSGVAESSSAASVEKDLQQLLNSLTATPDNST